MYGNSADRLDAAGLAQVREACEALWSDAECIWTANESKPAFQGYVSADYPAILARLVGLRGRATTFLEWGSGLGVVTIMASLLGYEAYGIEVEPELVALGRELAGKHCSAHISRPVFGTGSFIPAEFDPRRTREDEFHRTQVDQPPAYDEIDMQLRDFDLVYAFPWPEEWTVFSHIIRKCAAPNTLLLRYDAREGLSLTRPAARRNYPL